jgi:AmmeMemoRadiSam system protein B
VHPLVHFDPYLFGRAWVAVQSKPARPLPGARVLVVPHHWVAGALILGPLRDLGATASVERVILVGPDHENRGVAPVTTSSAAWSTPFGRVAPDRALVDALVSQGLARQQPGLLTDEHSVAGLVPAVARALPGATVVPLLLRGDTSSEQVAGLARALAPQVASEGTVMVVAVDFAHDVPASAVPRLNGQSLAALRSLDDAAVLRWGNEHLDSPAAIVLAMTVARAVGATHFELMADTDASAFGAPASQPVTSYVVGYYR